MTTGKEAGEMLIQFGRALTKLGEAAVLSDKQVTEELLKGLDQAIDMFREGVEELRKELRRPNKKR